MSQPDRELWVSVVVPCRNRADYLLPTLESIFAQSYPHIECIVIDACSTDGTLDLLAQFAARIGDPQRFRWISEPDQGHADAINKGWKLARGDILAWLNADDLWHTPEAVAHVMEYFRGHPGADVVYGDCGAVDEQGVQVGYSYLRPWNLEHAVLHCDNCIPQPAAFIRRRILDRVGLLDTRFHQKKDHELWLRIAAHGGQFHYLQGLLAHARAIRGLSFDGVTAAPACVQLTEHFFANLLAKLPDEARRPLQRLRLSALSNAHLRAIDYARADGRPAMRAVIRRHAIRAALADRGNFTRAAQLWRSSFTPFSSSIQNPKSKIPNASEVAAAWLVAQVQAAAAPTRREAIVIEASESILPHSAALRGWRTLAVAATHRPWPYHHPNLRLLRENPESLHLPGHRFDLVIASALEPQGLTHAAALLAPGGKFLFVTAYRPQVEGCFATVDAAWRLGADGKWRVCCDECGKAQLYAGALIRRGPSFSTTVPTAPAACPIRTTSP
jgi:glycosyltransferase involved in cell wall biosynthesis